MYVIYQVEIFLKFQNPRKNNQKYSLMSLYPKIVWHDLYPFKLQPKDKTPHSHILNLHINLHAL